MKWVETLALAVFVCLALALPAAADYTDQMTDLENNSIKSYSNLSLFPTDGGGWKTAPDSTVLSFASTGTPVATATYRVQNAQRVTVGIYSNNGTFVSRVSDGSGKLALGMYTDDAGVFSGRTLTQALLSPSAKAVYTVEGGSAYQARYNDIYYEFAEAANPGDLIGYGVNVLVSADGQSYRRIALQHVRLRYLSSMPLVYEEYSGAVPGGIQYVRVELNDVSQFPLYHNPSQSETKAPRRYNCLASVTLGGDNLVLGIQEPLEREPQTSKEAPPESVPETGGPTEPDRSGQKESSSKKESSSGKSASSKKGAAGNVTAQQGGGTTGDTTAEKTGGSKFEGVIQRSQASKKPESQKTPIGAIQEPVTESSMNMSSLPPEPRSYMSEESVLFFQIPRQQATDHFTAGITVYIIIMAALLVLVLLSTGRARKK